MNVIAKQARESALHPEVRRGTSSLEVGKRHEQTEALGTQGGKWVERKQTWARESNWEVTLKRMQVAREPGWGSSHEDVQKWTS